MIETDVPADHADVMESIANAYDARAVAFLGRACDELERNGWTVERSTGVLNMDEFRWEASANQGEFFIGLDLTLEEAAAYGDDPPYGVSFGLLIVAHGGMILGQFTPYNYTDECWVDGTDAEAVAARWALFEAVDVTNVPSLANEGLTHWAESGKVKS